MNVNPYLARIVRTAAHSVRRSALPLLAAAAVTLAAGSTTAQENGQGPSNMWDLPGRDSNAYDPPPKPKLKTQRNVIPIVLGATFFGVGYVSSLMYMLVKLGLNSAESDESKMAPDSLSTVVIPCVGPFIAAPSNDNISGALIGLGIVETLSLGTFIYGLATPKHLPETSSGAAPQPSIQIAPLVGGSVIGLQLAGSF